MICDVYSKFNVNEKIMDIIMRIVQWLYSMMLSILFFFFQLWYIGVEVQIFEILKFVIIISLKDLIWKKFGFKDLIKFCILIEQ